LLNQVRLPKLNDKQLIALNLGLTAEGLGIDSELCLFKQLPDELKPMIERSVYRPRRRSLSFKSSSFDKKYSIEFPRLVSTLSSTACRSKFVNSLEKPIKGLSWYSRTLTQARLLCGTKNTLLWIQVTCRMYGKRRIQSPWCY